VHDARHRHDGDTEDEIVLLAGARLVGTGRSSTGRMVAMVVGATMTGAMLLVAERQNVGARSSEAPVEIVRHVGHPRHHESAVQSVIARVALDQIGSDAAVQNVVAGSPGHFVVTVVSRFVIVACSAKNSIVPGLAQRFVVAIPAEERIVSRSAVEEINPAFAE
jgi:hypothetical protein